MEDDLSRLLWLGAGQISSAEWRDISARRFELG
jgi:hypothetical protein